MGEKSALEGSLGFVTLADIFQILGGNGSTGVLELTTPYAPHSGLIYFVGGNPVNAWCGPQGAVEAIYALFGWTEGRFQFREEEVSVGQVIKQSRMQIVLDALRMVDDGVIQKVGPPHIFQGADKEKGPPSGEGSIPQIIRGPLVDYSYLVGEEEFRKGDRILREGGHGKWIWVVLEGAVEVNRETIEGPFAVARLGEGCFLGTFGALLFHEHSRSAHVKALDYVRLGLLDTERLSRIYTSLSPDFRAVLVGLDERLRRVTNRLVEIVDQQDSLSSASKDKETVIEMGSPSEELFAIREGEALVICETEKGSFPVLQLGKDDVYGFIPFLDTGHEPRSAAVAAGKNLKTRPIDAEALQIEHSHLPAVFKNLIYHMGVCIYTTTRTLLHIHERG